MATVTPDFSTYVGNGGHGLAKSLGNWGLVNAALAVVPLTFSGNYDSGGMTIDLSDMIGEALFVIPIVTAGSVRAQYNHANGKLLLYTLTGSIAEYSGSVAAITVTLLVFGRE